MNAKEQWEVGIYALLGLFRPLQSYCQEGRRTTIWPH